MIKLIFSIFILSYEFLITFFTYIKLSKDSSANYYQNNKKRLQKKVQYVRERNKNLPEHENKRLLSIEKSAMK